MSYELTKTDGENKWSGREDGEVNVIGKGPPPMASTPRRATNGNMH